MKKLGGLKRPVGREDDVFIPELPGVALQEAPSSAGDMVERVARAIYEGEGVSLERDFSASVWADAKRSARAALEAMREPTDAMVEAAAGEGWGHELSPRVVEEAYRAMIDAALSPLPEPPK